LLKWVSVKWVDTYFQINMYEFVWNCPDKTQTVIVSVALNVLPPNQNAFVSKGLGPHILITFVLSFQKMYNMLLF
jgi:hypothetical protein